MNSNDFGPAHLSIQPLSNGIQWQNKRDEGRFLATYTDDGAISDKKMLTYLSESEKERASTLHVPDERRHFIVRRSFQRLFLHDILAFDRPPAFIAIIHQRDTRPVCLDAPKLHLSFSSSENTFIACASATNTVGIDIERKRMIANPSALAKRFFTSQEANSLAALPAAEQDLHFLYYWTAKEAALKAIGKGIIFGLNTFIVERIGSALTYRIRRFDEENGGWDIQHLDFMPQHVIALVEKNPVNKI